MITSEEQAIRIQTARRQAGLKGRSKAVRRWFKRTHGRAVEGNEQAPQPLRIALDGNFEGCRSFEETHPHK